MELWNTKRPCGIARGYAVSASHGNRQRSDSEVYWYSALSLNNGRRYAVFKQVWTLITFFAVKQD